jgi:hypothetical protein
VYREAVLINSPSEHEGLILEAPRGAILEITRSRESLISLNGMRGVVLRDLRIRAVGTEVCALISLTGSCSDVCVERVTFEPPLRGGQSIGVEIEQLPAVEGATRPAVVVRDCTFRKSTVGVVLRGVSILGQNYGAARPIHAVMVRDNLFLDCGWGVMLKGQMHQVCVVGNRFRSCTVCAWQIEHFLPQSTDVVLANNTTLDCPLFLRVWDDKVRSHGVRMCNNLSLGTSYPDALAIDNGGQAESSRGLGDGTLYSAAWSFDHNWREVKLPEKPSANSDGWIPAGKQDVVIQKIDGINRDPRSPDFLRPDRDSPLATKGAGKDDSGLPSYVGAVPPGGVKPWDWERTWRSRQTK